MAPADVSVDSVELNVTQSGGVATVTILNQDEFADFRATVILTVTSDGNQILNEEATYNVGPEGTREVDFEFTHSLSAGDPITACGSVTNIEPVGGL